MMDYIEYYAQNNMARLRRLADGIIRTQFPWLPQMYHDDFYSIASEVLMVCASQFDFTKGARFESYLIGCLMRKFKTRLTYMNRQRRSGGEQNLSVDALIEEGKLSDIAVEEPDFQEGYSDKMMMYLGRISKLQKDVLFMLADGYAADEIMTRLGLTSNEFTDACLALRAYRNVSVLF